MKKLTRLALVVMLLVMVLAGCAQSEPEENAVIEDENEGKEEEIAELVLAHDYQTEHPIHTASLEFMEAINESGVGIQCKVFPNGTLYQSNWDILIEMLQSNSVQAGVDSITVFSSVVENMSALQLPFMFANTEELQSFIDSDPEIMRKWEEEAKEKKLVIGSFNAKSFRQLINSKKMIKTPEDIKNMKFRVPNNPFFISVFELLGTKPVPLPSGEIYSAIQLGTVVGEDNPIPNVYDAKTFEVAKYYTIWDYIADGDVLVFSKEFYDSLNDDQKAVVDAAADQYEKTLYSLNEGFKDDAVEKMKDAGVEFYYMSESEKEPFKTLVAPLYDEKQTKMGDDWSLLMDAIKEIR